MTMQLASIHSPFTTLTVGAAGMAIMCAARRARTAVFCWLEASTRADIRLIETSASCPPKIAASRRRTRMNFVS